MHYKVDSQFACYSIHPADGVGPGEGPLFPRHGFPDAPQIQRGGVLDARLRENKLDVPVHKVVVGEVREAVPAGNDPDHVRGQFFPADHGEVDLRTAFFGGAGGGGHDAHKASLS
jgi:hypothetical protein